MKIKNPTDAEIVKAALAWVRPSMRPDNEEHSHEWQTRAFQRQQRAEERLWRLAVDAYKRRVILARSSSPRSGRKTP